MNRQSFHRFVTASLLAAACLFPAPAIAEAPNLYKLANLRALEDAFTELADEVRPSVVSIRCYQSANEDRGDNNRVRLPISQGSGFIIDEDGFIATNRHVVEGADIISVILSGGVRFDAELIKADLRSDLAVLKIDRENLPAVGFSDLASVKVGQWAFACGNPFGLAFDSGGEPSVTYGVVSALGRQMTDKLTNNPRVYYYGNLIETSAAINPGSSGGPLFNIEGDVIGVVTAIETSSGVNEGHGFAIPVDKNTRRIIDTLKRGEEVRYGFLGVEVHDVPEPLSKRVRGGTQSRGAEIARISPSNGPAAEAGLAVGDVILQVDGNDVQGADHLVRLVQYMPVGGEIDVTFTRRSVKRKATVRLGDRMALLGLSASAEK